MKHSWTLCLEHLFIYLFSQSVGSINIWVLSITPDYNTGGFIKKLSALSPGVELSFWYALLCLLCASTCASRSHGAGWRDSKWMHVFTHISHEINQIGFLYFFPFKYSKMKFVTWLDCFPPFPARCEKEWATCSRRGPGWGTWQGHEGRWRWLSVVGAEQSGDPEGRRRVDSSEPSQSWKRRTELWKVSRDEPGYYTGHFKPFRPEPQVSLDSDKIDVNKYIIKYIRNMVFFQTSANQERQGCL